LRNHRSSSRQSKSPVTLFARLGPSVTLERGADWNISVLVDSRVIALGKFSTSVAKHAANLRAGLQLDAFGSSDSEKEIHELVRRLARCGLLEYRLARARRGADLVIIEPQVRDYTPRLPKLGPKYSRESSVQCETAMTTGMLRSLVTSSTQRPRPNAAKWARKSRM
jgi:hypothetical protein